MVPPGGAMRLVTFGCCVLAATISRGTGFARPPASGQLPEKFTNLQVLPKDITPKALVDVMKSFAIDLGTRCEHCHVGAGNDLSKFDFSSDAKPEKATARKMMTMITALHAQYLNAGGDTAGRPKVTCYTCHRGALKPLTAPPSGAGVAQ
jgi:hypothetical protein